MGLPVCIASAAFRASGNWALELLFNKFLGQADVAVTRRGVWQSCA
jgi:hypothetical protein